MVNTSDILPNTPRYLKVPLIFFNVILWILGIVLIAVGGYSVDQLQSVKQLINVSIPAGIIVLGVFVVVLTVVGCAVAYKERLVGLIFYTVVMLILLICLIGVGGGAYTYREKAPTALTYAWSELLGKGGNLAGSLETQFACCGWNSSDHSSYANTTGCVLNTQNTTTTMVNSTCYENVTITYQIPCFDCTVNNTAETVCQNVTSMSGCDLMENVTKSEDKTYYNQPYACQVPVSTNVTNTVWNPYNRLGCNEAITSYVQSRVYVAAVAGIVVGVIEFVCMLFSLFLIIRLCRSPRARSYD